MFRTHLPRTQRTQKILKYSLIEKTYFQEVLLVLMNSQRSTSWIVKEKFSCDIRSYEKTHDNFQCNTQN